MPKLEQIKELLALLNEGPDTGDGRPPATGLNYFIGEDVIIRTYSAGVWFGTLTDKSGNEVILHNARRMWRWWCKEGISLSSVAVHGLNESKSRIAEPVKTVWLEAIEIIPVGEIISSQISEQPYAKSE